MTIGAKLVKWGEGCWSKRHQEFDWAICVGTDIVQDHGEFKDATENKPLDQDHIRVPKG